ncbi:MAG: hypothetical protein E2O81_02365 [Betaproteobacteria bacterium]|nr:MAG: hypothetical protein E2O81_02365 [Betaproteobacteria bacterium]
MSRAFGWVVRLGWTALLALVALPAYAQLMLAHEGHKSGDCTIKTGSFPVSFRAYEKPKGALPPSHAYCDHVPEVGEHILTVDLQGTKSREIPIAMRLVLMMEGQADETTIMSEPAKLYPSGSITIAVNLKELGQYNLLLETEKAGKMSTAVSIPIQVGGGHSGIGTIGIVLLLGVSGIATFFWLRRRTSTTLEEPQK